MDVKAIPGEDGDKLTCPRCSGKVFEAERCVTRVGSYHKGCFSCIECSKKLDSTTCCEGTSIKIEISCRSYLKDKKKPYLSLTFLFYSLILGPDMEIYCKSCYSFEFGAKSRFRPRAGRMNR